jgi:hypothetical protein
MCRAFNKPVEVALSPSVSAQPELPFAGAPIEQRSGKEIGVSLPSRSPFLRFLQEQEMVFDWSPFSPFRPDLLRSQAMVISACSSPSLALQLPPVNLGCASIP